MRIGYKRVSTTDQTTARQLDGIQLDKVFEDQASGGHADRPALKAMIEFARDGDVVIVHSIDRLARNIIDLWTIIKQINAKGVTVEIMKEGFVFSSGDADPMQKFMASIVGAFAEFERSMIRERQAEGIRIAKQKGIYKGRKPALTSQQETDLRQRLAAGERPADLCRTFKISKTTFYRYTQLKQSEITTA